MKYLIFEHVVDQILSISAMQKYEHTHTHQVVEVNEYRCSVVCICTRTIEPWFLAAANA